MLLSWPAVVIVVALAAAVAAAVAVGVAVVVSCVVIRRFAACTKINVLAGDPFVYYLHGSVQLRLLLGASVTFWTDAADVFLSVYSDTFRFRELLG